MPTYKFDKDAMMAKLPAQQFASNNGGVIHNHLTAFLQETLGQISTVLADHEGVIEILEERAKVRDEELDMLWWLQTGFSSSTGKSFAEVGVAAATCLLPFELEALSQFYSEPPSLAALLFSALKSAGGGQIPELSVFEAVVATPRQWRESVKASIAKQELVFACPVLLALVKSLETANDTDWLPVYRNLCDFDLTAKYSAMEIAHHVFRERLLVSVIVGNA